MSRVHVTFAIGNELLLVADVATGLRCNLTTAKRAIHAVRPLKVSNRPGRHGTTNGARHTSNGLRYPGAIWTRLNFLRERERATSALQADEVFVAARIRQFYKCFYNIW